MLPLTQKVPPPVTGMLETAGRVDHHFTKGCTKCEVTWVSTAGDRCWFCGGLGVEWTYLHRLPEGWTPPINGRYR
ncbi:MAG: hypothetical protein CMB06_00735 [Euryarchaeota archaeon]|nr:hypothetical protein [Euryarchaeota archaeon]